MQVNYPILFYAGQLSDLTVSVTDVQSRPVLASPCVAVADSNFVQPENTHDIISAYIENRNQISSGDGNLSNAGELNDEQLDILMMTAAGSYGNIVLKAYNPEFLSSGENSVLYIVLAENISQFWVSSFFRNKKKL